MLFTEFANSGLTLEMAHMLAIDIGTDDKKGEERYAQIIEYIYHSIHSIDWID